MESLPPIPFPDLATKADLLATKTDLEHQLEKLRTELGVGLAGLRTELKDDMHAGFTRVDAGFAKVYADMHAGFARSDANIRTQTYWMIGTMITLFGVLAALIVICD